MTAHDIWIKPTPEQLVDALSDARSLIQAGWTQRQAHAVIDGRDCYCAMGAIAEVSGTLRIAYPVMWDRRVEVPGEVVPGAWIRDAVTAAVLAALPPRFGTIAAYNDQPARTSAEMVALFNSAISIARRVAVTV